MLLERMMDGALRALEWLLGLLLVAMVVFNFANVVGRYGFGATVLGAEEMQVFAMVWLTFLGAVIVTWRGVHLRMDAISTHFPAAVKVALRWIEVGVAVATLGYFLQYSWFFVSRVKRIDQLSDAAHIPMWIPHSAVLVGFSLIALMLVLRALRPAKQTKQDY
jgi:TRAP-type C4-dicarboxylate transport system permease small subunit